MSFEHLTCRAKDGVQNVCPAGYTQPPEPPKTDTEFASPDHVPYIQTFSDRPFPSLFLFITVNFQFSLKDGHTPLELLFWTGGLIFLAVIDPIGSSLPELCLYKLVGFDSCPGCGLGQSISFLLHGEATNSFDAHVLGPVAFLLIINRIVMLTKNNLTIKRKEHSHA